MRENERSVEIRFQKHGAFGRPAVEVLVPQGQRLIEMVNLHKKLAEEILPGISPTGCQPCMSGCDLIIRERWEEVINFEVGEILG